MTGYLSLLFFALSAALAGVAYGLRETYIIPALILTVLSGAVFGGALVCLLMSAIRKVPK